MSFALEFAARLPQASRQFLGATLGKKLKKSPQKQLSKKPKQLFIPSEPQPALSRAESAAQIREILDRLFDGNAEQIVKSLADSGDLSPEEMVRMKEVFTKGKSRKRK